MGKYRNIIESLIDYNPKERYVLRYGCGLCQVSPT
ncbi:DUF6146 family protein [Chryseobacterium ginsenosidimutans]